ncbi:MAG: response regulator [Verrucomicrobia bacterium]|nr:response regulator [Verrucomicrobiota bacterium]
MLHALLIDDEASARADLREKLAAHPEVAIVGEAATLRAARALLTNVDYNLVFLDVQLVGGESFQLLPDVRRGAGIVFATAHERYAVRAFESRAVDYLLKPIDRARLAEALRRAAEAHTTGPASPHPTAALDSPARRVAPPAPLEPLVAHRLIAALENASEVALTDDERVYLRQCLEAWEDSLAPTHALRTQTAGFPRAVRYERDTEPTRLFLAGAPASRARRWWRALCARLSS